MSTPILPFAKWLSGTNQNSIPANDNSLRNQILNGNVISQAVTAQPASPTEGDTYIIASTHTGAQWSGFTPKDLAIFSAGTWYAFAPVEGVVVNVAGSLYKYLSAAWVAVGGGVTTDNDPTLAANSASLVATQQATKSYVDNLVQGLSWKKAVRAATTTNGTLATAFANAQTIDGVVLATGDRILLKNQSAASENGIYVVAASGAPTRATDADTGSELVNASVMVSEGSTLADTQWTCSTNAPITVGSTSLSFAQLSAGGGGVTSVDASGGVETASGSAITATGTIRGTTLVNAQTGTTYTYVTGDRGKLVTHANASAIAGTLPQAVSTFGSGWYMWVKNKGAGTLTITPTTSTIDGAATLVLTAGQWALVTSDGTNYQSAVYAPAGGGGSLTNWTESVNSAAPNASIPLVRFLATNAATNVDAVVSPKGFGAFTLNPSDNSTANGSKRGIYSVDLQLDRSNAAFIASGGRSALLGGANNTASGSYATVAGGTGNSTSSDYTFIAGRTNTITGTDGICIGQGNSASNNNAIAIGNGNTASGVSSLALGYQSTNRGIQGAFSYSSGVFSAVGDAQTRTLVPRAATTSATPFTLNTQQTSDNSANVLVLPTGSTFKFRADVIARQATTGDSVSWTVVGLIKNVAGTVSMVGTPTVTQDFVDTGATTWALAITANNTLKSIAFGITGEASKSIKWVADIRALELVG